MTADERAAARAVDERKKKEQGPPGGILTLFTHEGKPVRGKLDPETGQRDPKTPSRIVDDDDRHPIF